MSATPLKIEVPEVGEVSGLWQSPDDPAACLALAHGAGAGMTHRSMVAIADGLETLGVATLRYQFPFMEKGGKRPDTPVVAHATVRAAVAEARARADGLPLFAGGRSFGGRMTSQAQSIEPLPGVSGPRVLRLSAASGRQAVGDPRGAPLGHHDPHAVSPGIEGCAG